MNLFMKLTNLKGGGRVVEGARLKRVWGNSIGFESRSLLLFQRFIFQKKNFFSKNSV